MMKKTYQKIRKWVHTQIQHITPGKNAVRGAALGLLALTALIWVVYSLRFMMGLRDPWVLAFSLALVLASILLAWLLRWTIRQLYEIPRFYKLALFIAIPLLYFALGFDWILAAVYTILASLLGAAVWVLKETGFKTLSRFRQGIVVLGLIVALGGLVAGGFLYAQRGFELDPIENAALSAEKLPESIEAVSPAMKGPYRVKILTYGSGEDRHRAEYGEEADIRTVPVNGLAFIDSWDGFGGWWREKYWGFDSKALPLNARVWYPEGPGPFPLVLVVHGNHGMQDYSDPGYDYLGELLASKGYILASVDENFINGSWSDIFGGLDEENDARGWLLLEHLRLWHEWNETAGNPFHQKIDTSNLALIGHSRGGEAVAHAAMFNALPYYPDDAGQRFDYGFNLKSVVAIAPVDGQYEPGDSRTAFEDVNYLVLHGSQDADVTSFMGAQQYERVTFTDSLYHFKSGVYIYGANHGQFNTSWGENDRSSTFTGLLNLKQQLSIADQERIAEVFIGGFLDATLMGKDEYLPLFMDARKGREWLPETLYLNQFEDSSLEAVATFDEDFDLSTLSREGSTAMGENLSVWREEEIQLKWQEKGSRALVAGWHYELGEAADSLRPVPDSLLASYTLRLPGIQIDSSRALVFSMAESTESSNPKSEGKWVDNETEENEDTDGEPSENTASGEQESPDGNGDPSDAEDGDASGDEAETDGEADTKPKEPIDFTIQLTDSTGQKLRFPLSRFSPLQREIKVRVMKTGWITGDESSENVFQTFYFSLEELRAANPGFAFTRIEEIAFIFDRSKEGVVIIDNIGFMDAF